MAETVVETLTTDVCPLSTGPIETFYCSFRPATGWFLLHVTRSEQIDDANVPTYHRCFPFALSRKAPIMIV